MMSALLQQQAAPAVTRRARQLHVGNLPPGLTGEEPEELFKTMMQVMHSLLPSAAALGRCPRPLPSAAASAISMPSLASAALDHLITACLAMPPRRDALIVILPLPPFARASRSQAAKLAVDEHPERTVRRRDLSAEVLAMPSRPSSLSADAMQRAAPRPLPSAAAHLPSAAASACPRVRCSRPPNHGMPRHASSP